MGIIGCNIPYIVKFLAYSCFKIYSNQIKDFCLFCANFCTFVLLQTVIAVATQELNTFMLKDKSEKKMIKILNASKSFSSRILSSKISSFQVDEDFNKNATGSIRVFSRNKQELKKCEKVETFSRY